MNLKAGATSAVNDSNEEDLKDDLRVEKLSRNYSMSSEIDFDLSNEYTTMESSHRISDITVMHDFKPNVIVVDESTTHDEHEAHRELENRERFSSLNIKFNSNSTQTLVNRSDLAIINKNFESNASLKSLNIGCEVASLSSLTSDYSQFDFTNPNGAFSNAQSSSSEESNEKSTYGISSFINIFGNRKSKECTSTSNANSASNTTNATNSTSKLDLFTSKLFSLKANAQKAAESKANEQTNKPTTSAASNEERNTSDSTIKSNHSFNNLNELRVIPNSVLIFENRPSHLPAKSQQESLKHKQEYEKMIQLAKKKGSFTRFAHFTIV
jgi:hypothetical protein